MTELTLQKTPSLEYDDTDSWFQETDESTIGEQDSLGVGSRPVKEKTSYQLFCLHLRLLLWKNYKLFSRSLKLTIFQLATPVFFCLLIVYLQWLADSFTTVSMPNPTTDVGPMKKCMGKNCVTIGFGIIGDEKAGSEKYEWINYAMKYVADDNGFEWDKDVKLLTVGETKDFYNHILGHQNQTLYGILFCTTEWKVGDVAIPCKFDKYDYDMKVYSLYFNFTLEPDIFLKNPITPGPTDPALLRLKLSLDNGIMSYYAQKNHIDPPKIEATTSNYPMPADRFLSGFSVITFAGPFYFFFTPMVTFMILLIEITKEKEQRLRHGLSVMGLKSSSFWLSWLITGVVLSIASTLVLIVMGSVCGFEFFWNTPWPIIFAIFFMFSMAMIMLAFLLSTLVNTQKIAYAVSFLFLLAGVVLQVILTNVLMVYLIFYPEEMQIWVDFNYIVRFIFSLYPPFSFSKIFGDIARITSSHYAPEEFRWIEGSPYSWSDLFKDREGVLTIGIRYHAPAPVDSLWVLLLNSLAFGLFAWYFDHILASNRGIADHPLFFLSRRYWCSKRRTIIEGLESEKLENAQIPLKEEELMSPATAEEEKRGTADLEREKVIQLEREGSYHDGIRILGIDKTFHSGTCKRKSLHALKNVYMEIGRGELLALLGHNGAGKSTLINILTGILGCSSGTAKIYGLDLRENINEIQHMIGLVPQFDILWGELTAAEHLSLFAELKGVPKDEIPDLIKKKLAEVNLERQENSLVRTFSGGMKRRLSVAIGGIGNPRILIMDEPTTGMDPVNKRSVWKLIRNMKRGKAFILTTHQMEEADMLADRVAIVVDGEVRCIGTPLSLKNHYGEGYRLSLVAEPNKAQEVEDLVQHLIPGAKQIDESGGSMVYSVPLNDLDKLKPVFGLMEGRETLDQGENKEQLYMQLRGLVKDVGLSHPTLEEVFMRVTSKKERKNFQQTLAVAAAFSD